MRTFTFELNNREVELRLVSEDMIKIEDTYKVRLIDFVQDYSIKNIITLLRYMLKGAKRSAISQDEAQKFFDELVDAKYSLAMIVSDIIMPACEASGLLSESDLQKIQEQKNLEATH